MAQVDRNALRILQRILDNETYGPKLVRLNKRSQRTVLELIEQHDGKAARRKITELDEARRARETAVRRERVSRHREISEGAAPEREEPRGEPDKNIAHWPTAAGTMGRLSAERHPDKVYRPDKYVTEAKKEGGIRDWQKYLALRGSDEAMIQDARYSAKRGDSWNVFWYHYW